MPVILDCDFLKKDEAADIPLGFNATCTIVEQIGDPVVFHDTVDGRVESLTDNVYDSRLVVGIIQAKSSDTECFVVTLGILEGIAAGLDSGAAVWVSTTGGLTTTKPATGHLQVLGDAVSSTDISVNIEKRKSIQV